MEITKVDLGCGQNKQVGFTGIDIASGDGVDIVHDLEIYPWPLETNSIEEVHVSHYIEHTKDMIKFMNELYRVMKSPTKDQYGKVIAGGKATIIAPYYTSMRCWQDPTHKNAISEASFLYYNRDWRVVNKLDHYPITCDFDFQYGYNIDPAWASRSQESRDFAIRHYWNVVNDIVVTLFKK